MRVSGTISAILKDKGSDVLTIAPDATVFDAIRLMAERNIGALIVTEGEVLVGVITERDYTRKVALKGKASRDTAVREILTTEPVTVTPSHTIEECMRLMTLHRIRHLPVVEEEKIAGIVSIGDLVNWIISAQDMAIGQLEGYIHGQYPA
jgi:CBS domain-containing protein